MKKIIAVVTVITLICLNASALAAASFTDMENHWAEEYVNKLTETGIIKGYEDRTYRPEQFVTRGEFIKLIVEAAATGIKKDSESSFSDTVEHWAGPYIEIALRNKYIVASEEGKSFRPDEYINRLDMVKAMCRALGLKDLETESKFVDINDGWVNRAYEDGLLEGYKDNGRRYFRKDSSTTRAEAATIIVRMLEYKENPEAFKEEIEDKREKEAISERRESTKSDGVPKETNAIIGKPYYINGLTGAEDLKRFNRLQGLFEYDDIVSIAGDPDAKDSGIVSVSYGWYNPKRDMVVGYLSVDARESGDMFKIYINKYGEMELQRLQEVIDITISGTQEYKDLVYGSILSCKDAGGGMRKIDSPDGKYFFVKYDNAEYTKNIYGENAFCVTVWGK